MIRLWQGIGKLLITTWCGAVLLAGVGCSNGSEAETAGINERSMNGDVRPAGNAGKAESFDDYFILKKKIILDAPSRESTFGEVDAVAGFHDGYLIVDRYLSQTVLYFDKEGHFIQRVGFKGDGPGGYFRPDMVEVLPDGHVVIIDAVRRRMIEYDVNLNFLKEVNLAQLGTYITPFASCVVPEGILLYIPNAKSKAVTLLDRDGNLLRRFGATEPILHCYPVGSGGGMAVMETGDVWVCGVTDPTITIYSRTGDMVHRSEALSRRSYMISERTFEGIRCNDMEQVIRRLKGVSTVNGLYNLGPKEVLVHYSHEGIRFDIVKQDGTWVASEILFEKPYCTFVGVVKDSLLFADLSSPDVMNQDNWNGVLYVYERRR